MILSGNVSLSRDWREQLSEGRQCISKRHDSLQPFSAKSLPGAGMSLLWEGGLYAGRHFSVRCNFLGPRQIEALGGSVGAAWLRGFTFLPVPLHRARESGVREHLLQRFFSSLGSSREDEDGPPRSHDALETSGAPDRAQDPRGPQRASSRCHVR